LTPETCTFSKRKWAKPVVRSIGCQDMPDHISGHLQRKKACAVILQTPSGPVETPFVAVDPDHKLVRGKRVGANAQHYRIQKGESKGSIGEAIRRRFALRREVDFERIQIDKSSFDERSRFILVPHEVKWRGVNRREALPAVRAPLSFNSKLQSELWLSPIEKRWKAAPDALKWAASQHKRCVHQRRPTNVGRVDEKDLLRLAGALDHLGLRVGPHVKVGCDCPDSFFQFLEFPEYGCPLELKTRSRDFKVYRERRYSTLARVVVLCLHHDHPHPPEQVDVLEITALAKHFSA
jgi:hypothetical protein